MRRALLTGSLLIGLTLLIASGASAQIVYTHEAPNGAAELWTMNDDGSNQHVLIAWNSIAPNDSVFGANLLPTSSTLLFVGHTDEYDHLGYGNDGTNYEGIYELVNGVVTRISGAPEDTPTVASSDGSPSQTADGRVVYDEIVSSFDGSGDVTGASESLLVRSLSGGAASTWVTTPPPFIHLGAFAADPTDSSLLAYESGSNPNELVVGNQSGTNPLVTDAQPNGSDPAWSPNGQDIVDVDGTPPPGQGGFSAGLWLFYGSSVRELLVDPDPDTQYSISSLSDPTFAGPNEILFDADDNIWEIPASCNMCTLAADAKQLTTDGTSAHPDSTPAWTSATITPLGGNTPPPSGTTFKVTLTATAGQKVLKQKGVVGTVKCNVICAFAAIAGIEIKGSKKELNSKQASGQLGAGGSKKITLKLSSSQLKTIQKAIKKHKKVTALIVADGKDVGGKTVQVHTSFTVKH
jgi:hypothetical protein